MSAADRNPETDPLYARPRPKRLAYATGMLLDAQDFSDEQTYHRGRLAQAVAFLSGGGTLAGLRAAHVAKDQKTPEEIRVAPGVAVDRLGRLVEIPRFACLRIERWFDATLSADGGDTLQLASYDNLNRFLSPRLRAEAGKNGVPPIPARAIVADVFLRFIACAAGLTPSFASGAFDSLDSVSTSRLQDAYELLLVARSDGLDDDFDGLPDPGPDLAAIGDSAQRRARLQDAVLDLWEKSGREDQEGKLSAPSGHPPKLDPTAMFLARVVIPVTADAAPKRDDNAVLVDNWSRRFVPNVGLMTRWLGA